MPCDDRANVDYLASLTAISAMGIWTRQASEALYAHREELALLPVSEAGEGRRLLVKILEVPLGHYTGRFFLISEGSRTRGETCDFAGAFAGSRRRCPPRRSMSAKRHCLTCCTWSRQVQREPRRYCAEAQMQQGGLI